MEIYNTKIYDCSRGCTTQRNQQGELGCQYCKSCCKREVYNWLENIPSDQTKDLFEVRFKNTRKSFFKNDSGQILNIGDIVVVESNTGHDVGIITLNGPVILKQLQRNRLNPDNFEFKKIYRKAKALDLERWQEAIAREHKTMIRSRVISANLGLKMKIGDVEFQGDGSKAIFYYIADERVDFRELIKKFAEEFRIRIEMKQIGARQEAGLIGGLGVCGRALCCSNYITNFQSISTSAARIQDLSLNPQKLAGQCGKLKCCLNYETAIYADAIEKMPRMNGPLLLKDGQAFLMKKDILRGKLYFSYDPKSLSNIIELNSREVIDVLKLNHKGMEAESIMNKDKQHQHVNDFVSAVGDDNIDRFDNHRGQKNKRKKRKGKEKKQ